MLRISIQTLNNVTKTVESVASQLSLNSDRTSGRDPVYFNVSEVTPETSERISHEQGAVIGTLFLLVIGAIAYTRY